MLTNSGASIKIQVPQTALQHITFTPANHLEAFSEYDGTEEAEGRVTSGEDVHCLGSTSPWEPKWQQVILQ